MQKRFLEVFSYDPVAGVLTNTIQRGRCAAGAKVTGINTQGYVIAKVDGVLYTAHRIIWMMLYGRWPSETDHINGNRSDNRLDNLREVNRSENIKNAALRSDNNIGLPGVHWCARDARWVVQYSTNDKRVVRGTKSLLEACCIRKAAEIEHRYHPNHGRPE